MSNFYFTYGTENHPYYGGWTQVVAPDMQAAQAAFRAYHPDRTAGLLNCSDYYSEEDFMSTSMAGPEGNFGFFCHELITLQRTPIREEGTGYGK